MCGAARVPGRFLKVHMVGDMDPELTTRLRDYTIFNHKHDVLTKQIASVLVSLSTPLTAPALPAWKRWAPFSRL